MIHPTLSMASRELCAAMTAAAVWDGFWWAPLWQQFTVYPIGVVAVVVCLWTSRDGDRR